MRETGTVCKCIHCGLESPIALVVVESPSELTASFCWQCGKLTMIDAGVGRALTPEENEHASMMPVIAVVRLRWQQSAKANN